MPYIFDLNCQACIIKYISLINNIYKEVFNFFSPFDFFVSEQLKICLCWYFGEYGWFITSLISVCRRRALLPQSCDRETGSGAVSVVVKEPSTSSVFSMWEGQWQSSSNTTNCSPISKEWSWKYVSVVINEKRPRHKIASTIFSQQVVIPLKDKWGLVKIIAGCNVAECCRSKKSQRNSHGQTGKHVCFTGWMHVMGQGVIIPLQA